MREPEREPPHLDAARRQRRRGHLDILDLEARPGIERLDAERIPHDGDSQMPGLDVGVLDAHIVAGGTTYREGGAVPEVATLDRGEIGGRRGLQPLVGLGAVLGVVLE